VFFFSLKCPRYVDSAIILEQTASFWELRIEISRMHWRWQANL
jgi:hypothetical protein